MDVAAALEAQLDLSEVDFSVLDESVVRDAAEREAERLGVPHPRPEHVLLGSLRLAKPELLAEARRVHIELYAARAHQQYVALTGKPDTSPTVVLLAGVPGTGKSTLAESLAAKLRAPVFSMDWQLGALMPFFALRDDNMLALADLNITASVARQLQLGLDVIIDAAGHERAVRARWREVTESLGGRFVGVECVCSDEVAHRTRVEARERGIPGWPATVSWEHVNRMRALWEPWDEPHLVLDAARPPEENLQRLYDYL